ncbi:MAG: hypothetical protein QF384_09335 [Alphaproteobacteria bacterium]|jgi:uncharacterized FlgJ-related protein|nr:hypothetical protein [Alphaproteobacteria bacterium]
MSRIPVWPFESGGLTLKNLAFATLTLAPLAVIYLAGQNIYRHYTAPDVHFMQASQLRIDETVNVRDRKKAFFDFMRPVVEAENRRILKLRRRILAARQAGQRPAWVAAAAKDYGIEWSGNEWRALLRRVDVLPLELALVQSANESSWGRSRFAQQGNNTSRHKS